MHELAICQALISQVESVARENNAVRVIAITLGIGPLSGVEGSLLKHAYPVASAASIAEGAELRIRTTPVRIACRVCGTESTVTPNRLVCTNCNDWRIDLISGDELLLIQVELDKANEIKSAASVLY